MLTIALTGGIGSGKTAVTELFQELASRADAQARLKIIDADVIARSLLAGSLKKAASVALREVHKLFGSDLFDPQGYLDRNKLRSLIFSSKKKKRQLEALLHPLIFNELFSQLSNIHSDNTIVSQKARINIVIIAIPLLFESKAETRIEKKIDRILVIDVPVELQIKRSIKRDNCSAKVVNKIINSQATRQMRLSRADDIIDNSGTFLKLKLKVESLFQYYCSLADKS